VLRLAAKFSSVTSTAAALPLPTESFAQFYNADGTAQGGHVAITASTFAVLHNYAESRFTRCRRLMQTPEFFRHMAAIG
jgi:hypothetical protein